MIHSESTQDDKILADLEPKELRASSLEEECMDETREDILQR